LARNDGQPLQDLVADIERLLAPTGFRVTSPVIERDEQGRQVSELDILIEGLGPENQPIRWLIECRDRPSAGPAGIEWIEQLVGRRARLACDEVIAVSTAGFSRPAREFAERQGVILRTVTALTEFRSDVLVQRVGQILRRVEPTGEIELAGLDERAHLPIGSQKTGIARLRRVGEERFQSLDEFAQMHYAPELREFAPGLAVRDLTLEISGVEILFAGDQAPGHAEMVRIKARVEEEAVAGSVVSLKRYDEAGRPRGHEGIYVFDSSQGRAYVKVFVVPSGDGTYIVNIAGDQRVGDYVFARASVLP